MIVQIVELKSDSSVFAAMTDFEIFNFSGRMGIYLWQKKCLIDIRKLKKSWPQLLLRKLKKGYILVERDLQETALKDTKPAVIQKEEWDKKNDKAKALIRVNMSDFGTQEYFDCRNRLGSLGSAWIVI